MTHRHRSKVFRGPFTRGMRRAKSDNRERVHHFGDEGFTLVELLIVVTIMPLIVGALSLGLISMFSLQSDASGRLTDSADAQIITANFVQDTQSAAKITTSASTTGECGTGFQVLGLEFGSGPVVSYVEQQQSGSKYDLARNYCTSTSTLSAPTSASTIAYDLLPPGPCTPVTPPAPPTCQAAPVAYDGSTVVSTSGGWTSVSGISKVVYSIYEPSSKYYFTLSSTPAAGASSLANQLGSPDTTDPSCGFALPGTGDFASTLCFVDFSKVSFASAEGSGKCLDGVTKGVQVTSTVPGGYTLSFCFTIALGNSGDKVLAVTTPIGAPSNGEGFLGNDINGKPYYAGIGCVSSLSPISNGTVRPSCTDPAIFQETTGATDTVTMSNILVKDPDGSIATGYEIVTADAETIDNNSFITWTSNLPLNLLPDFANTLGDACNNVPSAETHNLAGWSVDNGDSKDPNTGLTGSLVAGLGTTSVTCTSNWQTDPSYAPARSGAAMLEVSPQVVGGSTQYAKITARINGEGYNAVAFGILLP